MNVPSRVKVFAWRARRNGLPTLLNLKTGKVVEEAICEWCNEDDEDINHALLNCKTVREIQYRGNNGDLEKLFLIAWGMWYRRNQRLQADVVLTSRQATENALITYKSHLQIQEPHGGKTVCRWLPPEQGMLKLNVDGAVFANQRRARVGVILRDDKGGVILLACKKENEINDPLEIELLAILRGLQICLPLGIPQLVIESDYLLLVDEIRNDKASRSLHENLVT
ncbi:uncharacterized protein LOC118348152 [Juglans regia]|uniref:Uncharacterized protein LOC118348150 n=1 Tax=Juglans regia TaxID=51240 RepID=A0A6P9ECH0_JUGRE|nr:uncharacterized protein LOC118348150 [Juglans regia]XP_035545036.1 uncharacterized protein LOC118348152 [Juglans regia]